MKKLVFVEKYAEATSKTKGEAKQLIESFLTLVEDVLTEEGKVTFSGWGTFKLKRRAKKTGINPSTLKPIKIPAKTVVKFKAGRSLAEKFAKAKVK